MILAGLQKNSFIDYPGKISCVLFTSGCNFICPYCHNADLARGEYPQRIELPDISSFLQSRQGMLEAVTITGGEPTLDKGLADLCHQIKAQGYPIKLDTNGSRPEVLHQLLEEELIDFVAMDIKAPLDDYAAFSKSGAIGSALRESIRLIMHRAPNYEFRTTCVHPYADVDAIAAIAASIKGARRYMLQKYNHQARCLDPTFGQTQDPALTDDQLQVLQEIAAGLVEHCAIR